MRDWGKVCITTRLEKMVENQFVHVWTDLILKGIRKTDAVLVVKDRVAHMAANDAVRAFLQSNCDSIFFLDSDADVGPTYLEELRELEDGWEFDVFQGFYVRRGWPPEAIWFKRTKLGDLMQCLVWKDNHTEETSMAGLHNTLIRREVFEAMLAAHPEIPISDFNWFYYPRHGWQSEDGTFSQEATDLGFRIGSTTKIKAGHISRVTTGWDTYQEHLQLSGTYDVWADYYDLVERVADFTGQSYDEVIAKVVRGSANVRDGLEKHNIDYSDPVQVKDFYGKDDSGYFYDLIAWNSTPLYQKSIKPLREISDKYVLVVGAGIGGEVEVLREKNVVFAFELPGALRDFLLWRYGGDDRVQIYTEPDDLRQIYPGPIFDLIIAIDTIEHFHPEDFETTMDAMLGLLKPDGQLYFRNNFEQQELYPIHFDHSEVYRKWIEDHDLEIDADHDTGVEIYRRKVIHAEAVGSV